MNPDMFYIDVFVLLLAISRCIAMLCGGAISKVNSDSPVCANWLGTEVVLFDLCDQYKSECVGQIGLC